MSSPNNNQERPMTFTNRLQQLAFLVGFFIVLGVVGAIQ